MRFSRKWLTKSLVGSFALVFLTSCGLDLDNILNPNGAADTTENELDYELIDIPFAIDTSEVDFTKESFGLAALNCSQVTFVGASSEAGYNLPQQVYTNSFKAVNGDKYLVKLISLTCGGVAYSVSNPGAANFDTWLAGDVGTLTNGDNSASLEISYTTSCYDADGCSTGDQLQLAAVGYTLGSDVAAAAATYEASINFTIGGADAPAFTFHGFAHRGFDVTNGRLKFSQAWDCNANIAGGGGPPVTCSGTNIDALKVIWVDDPGGTPTAAQMSAAIVAATSGGEPTDQGSINVEQGTHKVEIGAPAANGITGNLTHGGVSVDLVLTGDDAYGTLVKYACIYEGVNADGITCSKVTFTGISQ